MKPFRVTLLFILKEIYARTIFITYSIPPSPLSPLLPLARYAYVYNVKGNLGFEGTRLDWATIALHTVCKPLF